ncbi:hypothetical protein BJ322DRAFT_280554 [Thelephora terrestris]|uniref:Uncharacterized protein n=1 Tax=Thelephora terrestris TaxID=56493 RepID=A0A9P6L2R7_9AGAM|nr:hypothetical protein BJ322DRAFT_280554 [Thelephora terrestris]
MTDAKGNGHRRGPSSFIPIAMPLLQARTSLSLNPPNPNTNKSGSFSDYNPAPHLSTPSRSFSVGHYPSPQTSPNSKTTFASSNSNPTQLQPQQQSTPVSAGKTTFKSFRSLLPFGPGKSPASPNTGSASILTPKRSFSLGQRPGKEKEKGGDKKSRSPVPNVADLPDSQKPPVLVIQHVPPLSEFGVKASQHTPGLSSLPPQLPPLRLQSEPQQFAPLISVTLPYPTSASPLSSASSSTLQIVNGMSSASIISISIQYSN